MLEKEKNKILNMNKILASKVIGQKEAIEKINQECKSDDNLKVFIDSIKHSTRGVLR